MLSQLRKPLHLPSVNRWDTMFDSMMNKLDLFSGEELSGDFYDYIGHDTEITDSAVIVRLALPGYSKDEIELEIENDCLNIHAEHAEKAPECCKNKKKLRSERIHAVYSQSIQLPGDVKAADASAVCCDGVLTVSIPRENSNLPVNHKITVK